MTTKWCHDDHETVRPVPIKARKRIFRKRQKFRYVFTKVKCLILKTDSSEAIPNRRKRVQNFCSLHFRKPKRLKLQATIRKMREISSPENNPPLMRRHRRFTVEHRKFYSCDCGRSGSGAPSTDDKELKKKDVALKILLEQVNRSENIRKHNANCCRSGRHVINFHGQHCWKYRPKRNNQQKKRLLILE